MRSPLVVQKLMVAALLPLQQVYLAHTRVTPSLGSHWDFLSPFGSIYKYCISIIRDSKKIYAIFGKKT
jgi:hypothetical protein